jgi:hypothetical protein
MTTPDFNLATSTGTPVSSPQKKSYRNAHDDDSSPSLSSSGLTSTSSNYTLALERPPSSFSSPSSTSKIEWQTVEEENATLENLSKLAFPGKQTKAMLLFYHFILFNFELTRFF